MLDGLPEVKIGVAYRRPDGSALPASAVPASLPELEAVEVEYETLPGWEQDISRVRAWGDLPANAKAYVRRIEELSGVPVRYIGVGPGRDALLLKPDGA